MRGSPTDDGTQFDPVSGMYPGTDPVSDMDPGNDAGLRTDAARPDQAPAEPSEKPPDALLDPQQPSEDERYMRLALDEARASATHGDVPVGAVLVQRGGRLLGSRGNQRELRHDATAHAEMLVLRDAAALLGGWRVLDATLYVTLEPCSMCAGALVQARISRLVYGALDPKAGAAGSVMDLLRDPRLNHQVDVLGGVLAEECGAVLREFFAARR